MADKYTHLRDIFEKKANHCGFWHGNPHWNSTERLFKYFGVKDDFELGVKLGDSFLWVYDGRGHYKHPKGYGVFDIISQEVPEEFKKLNNLTDDDLAALDNFNWPEAKYYDFSGFAEIRDRAKSVGMPIISGALSPFYHNLSDLFGMENYFVKMHTDPELVLAVTERIVGFYTDMNDLFLADHRGDIEALFFGNDFGTQLDLMVSPEMFRKFIMPFQTRIAKQAKDRGLYAVLHSCGSVVKAIPDLIEAGVDGLHPIQALAAGMDAENLASKFRDKIVFVGGVDTQVMLREGTAATIKAEVKRLKDIFGNNFIVSPSHEAILPDIPPENIAAMAEEVWK
ncbi:hypothetical protein FACS1894219_09540 [Clostridia bacterium]|nr:hypothetical protein FACS1894219_09540 [Clostridia bacterium]